MIACVLFALAIGMGVASKPNATALPSSAPVAAATTKQARVYDAIRARLGEAERHRLADAGIYGGHERRLPAEHLLVWGRRQTARIGQGREKLGAWGQMPSS